MVTELFNNMLAISFIGAILFIFLIIVKKVFRGRIPPKAYLVMWIAIFIRLLIPFQLEGGFAVSVQFPFLISSQNIHNIQLNKATEAGSMNDSFESSIHRTNIVDAYTGNIPDLHGNNNLLINNGAVFQGDKNTADKGYDILKTLASVWISGFLILMGIILVIYMKTLRKISKVRMYESEYIASLVKDCSKNIKLSKNIRVFSSDLFGGPCIFGILRPRLFLPQTFVSCQDDNGLKSIIMHEMYHVKYFHNALNVIMLIVTCIHWFNPMIWIALFKSRTDIESVCDEAVVKVLPEANLVKYGETIIRYAALSKKWRPVLLHTGMSGGKNAMKMRIESISASGTRKLLWVVVSVILTISLGACGALSALAWVEKDMSSSSISSDNTANTAGNDSSSANEDPAMNTEEPEIIAGINKYSPMMSSTPGIPLIPSTVIAGKAPSGIKFQWDTELGTFLSWDSNGIINNLGKQTETRGEKIYWSIDSETKINASEFKVYLTTISEDGNNIISKASIIITAEPDGYFTVAGPVLTVLTGSGAENQYIPSDSEFSVRYNKGSIALMDWDNRVNMSDLLGKPVSEEVIQLTNADTYNGSFKKTLEYNGLEIEMFSPKDNGKSFYVTGIKILNSNYVSSRGVKVGDSLEALKKKYPGIPMVQDGRTDENNCAYEYSLREEYKFLQFEVKGGKVEKIHLYHLLP